MVGMTVQATVTTVTRSRNTTMISMRTIIIIIIIMMNMSVVVSRHSMTMVTMSRRILLWNGQTFDVS